VTVPVAGHFVLAADQGRFADQDLGHLDVAAVRAAPAGGGSSGGIPVVPAVVTGLAIVLLAVQTASAVRSRRRPVPVASA
jgi:hypothetical protein